MKKRFSTRQSRVKKGIPVENAPVGRPWKPILLGAFMLGISLIVFFLWLPRGTNSSGTEAHQGSSGIKMSGEALARIHCQACHLFTEPALLDRQTWEKYVFPEMKIRMGLNPKAIEQHSESKYLKASGLFPEQPMISIEDWDRIVSYYLSNAPNEVQSTSNVENIKVQLTGFDIEMGGKSSSTTLTFIDEKRGQLLIGDDTLKGLGIFDSAGQLRQGIRMNNTPIGVWPVESGIYVTSIGSFSPSDIPKGSLSFLPRQGDRYGTPRVILSELERPTHTAFGDLNGDGRDDMVISMFGNQVGRLSWFENLGEENYKEHILVNRAGTIQTALEDMNRDGFLDILVLTAQGTEAMEVFYNNGKGEFTSERIFQKNPLFGHTSFEMADFDGDGKPDLLVVNGDNGEYASPLKSFHGLRIYLNRGKGKFKEAYFFPMNGAYRAVVADFDEDGDLDVAAVSYFPDYRQEPRESFVYLENQGDLSFRPFTFPEFAAGRWITLAAGDLDGDGDIDLVLGSNTPGPTAAPQDLQESWKKSGRSFVILRNRLR